jgi:hypothetical protein
MTVGAGKKHSEAVFEKSLMKEDLLDIRGGIKAGRYVNEATVSQGIVQRLLHSLGGLSTIRKSLHLSIR